MFVYKVSGRVFESCLHFRYCPCFEKGAPWDSGNYRVWIHSKKWVHGMITKYSRTFSSVVHGKSWNPTEDSSDDLWFSKYHAFEYKIDLQAFPCTSRSFKLQTQRLITSVDCGLLIVSILKACLLKSLQLHISAQWWWITKSNRY